MLDTVHLRLSQEQAGSNLRDCLPYLTELSETCKEDGQVYFTGHLNNCRAYLSESGLFIKGSLPKFYLGDNLHTLNRSDSRRAFEMMEDTLHLPVRKATVTRVDAGLNLMTDYKPELYYPYLGPSSYYQRLTQPKSISYKNGLRLKQFYNKIAESKSKGGPIPAIYQGRNVLRYEVSYMQRLPKQFNQALITPATLTEEGFYMGLIDKVLQEYEVIQKVGLINMDTSKIKSPKDYLKQVLALTIQEKGLDAFLHHVDLLRELDTFDKPEYYSRLRTEIKRLSKGPAADTPELIQELNKKVARVKQNYR
ncbi:phage/plasmid replication domain-containing protein [Rufibacter roseolus]|uniref:phage/plasmid replication domain-containing protein n=1 Tax=Rufibacter roseolus TaxID=2817375 RepID=UPI00293D99C8|nr:phage/plasmid replication protein [Rufibacter roseolus]